MPLVRAVYFYCSNYYYSSCRSGGTCTLLNVRLLCIAIPAIAVPRRGRTPSCRIMGTL